MVFPADQAEIAEAKPFLGLASVPGFESLPLGEIHRSFAVEVQSTGA